MWQVREVVAMPGYLVGDLDGSVGIRNTEPSGTMGVFIYILTR